MPRRWTGTWQVLHKDLKPNQSPWSTITKHQAGRLKRQTWTFSQFCTSEAKVPAGLVPSEPPSLASSPRVVMRSTLRVSL